MALTVLWFKFGKKEVYKKNKAIRIINHEGGTYGNTQTFNDKYHRETFFISVHTRNLATPQVIAEKTGESIGTGTSYNKWKINLKITKKVLLYH